MKLIVSIDKENYKRIKDDVYDTHDIHRAIISIRRGTSLDVLDKIRAEIEQITDTMGVSYNQYVSKIDVLQIIDKYREGEEE